MYEEEKMKSINKLCAFPTFTYKRELMRGFLLLTFAFINIVSSTLIVRKLI
jgi:hypothetical protein